MNSGSIVQTNRNTANGEKVFELVELPNSHRYPPDNGYRPTEQHPLLSYWRVLKKRKWTIVGTFAIIFVLAVFATLRMTRLYEAVSRIAVYPENANILGLKDLENGTGGEDWDYNVALETQLSILRSDALALKVIEALHLDSNPRFMGYNVVAEPSSNIATADLQPDSRQLATMLSLFRSGLSVQVVPRTRVIEIGYIH